MKRILKHFFKKTLKGLGLILLLGMIIWLVKQGFNFISPIVSWFLSLVKIDPKWQASAMFGLLIVSGYIAGHIGQRSHIVQTLLMKIPFLRKLYYEKIRGGKPAIIIPDGKTCIQAIYMGPQLIEILGENPKKIHSSRTIFQTFPVPITGYAEYIPEEWVYMVTNISLSEWLANDIMGLAREIQPGIQALPLVEFREKHNSKKRRV
jgi:uncharacterized membrane protein